MSIIAILYCLSKLAESFAEQLVSGSFVYLLGLDQRNKGRSLQLRFWGGGKTAQASCSLGADHI